MIQYILLQNRQGKTRLSKYYRPYTDEEKVKLESEIHRLVTTRDPKFTNFVEVRASAYASSAPTSSTVPPTPRPSYAHAALRADCRAVPHRPLRRRRALPHPFVAARAPAQFRAHKLIYRRYAGLFFTLCVDVNDNELLYFESIHLFVELLDQFFGNVCELDLVFNFNKVYMILDEFFLAGEVQETSKQAILHRVQELDKLE